MKLNLDRPEMLKAMIKAAWPFIAGALGGILSGCTVGGIGPNFFPKKLHCALPRLTLCPLSGYTVLSQALHCALFQKDCGV